MVGTHADELEAFSAQRRLQVRAAEMASVLRELRTNARFITTVDRRMTGPGLIKGSETLS